MRYPGGLIATTPVNQQYPSGVWTGPQVTPYQTNNVWGNDTSFKSTTLLLHGDGATTPFVKDVSTNNFQIALNGDTKPNNLTPFITNGYWGNYFDGSGDYLTLPNATTLALGTSDFTVEGWFNFSSNSAPAPYNTFGLVSCYENQSGSFGFTLAVSTSSNAINVGIGDTNLLTTSFTISVGTWYHFAVSRSSGTIRLFVNGSLATSASNSSNFTTSTSPTSIGSINVFGTGNTMLFTGYASNVRIVKGTAVYTSAFTPSTTPLTAVTNTALLTCQSNWFVDNSTNAYAITRNGDTAVSMQQPFTAPSGTSLYGSGYFDGTGDWLSLASSSTALPTGTQDFCVEMWLYWQTQGGTYPQIISNPVTNGFQIYYDVASGLLAVGIFNVSNVITYTIAQTALSGAWTHLVVTRSGNTFRMFVNGVLRSNGTNTISFASLSTQYVGSDGSRPYTGYISNVRTCLGSIPTSYQTSSTTNGTSVFSSPTDPVTTSSQGASNTSLLTLQTNGPENNNGFLDSSINSLPITRNGNPTQGSLNPYQTTGYWSNAFDGSGDYLTIPSSSTFSFTGSFTWEVWVYLPVTTSGAEIISKHLSGVTGWYMLSINSSLNVNFVIWDSSNNSNNATTSGAITLGQWNHIAGGRNGSTVFVCLNGVYTSVALTVTPRTTNNAVNIGINLDNSSSAFNGYMSNLRCVSAAVYTGNYTVPTAPLTAIANTQLLTCQSNRFRDNSGNSVALTASGNTSVQNFQPFTLPALQYTPQGFGGSGYFDGSGDGVTSANNIGFAFGTGDFTYEAYYYSLDTGASQRGMFDTRVNSSSTAGVLMREDSSGFLVYINGGTLFTASGRVPYTWQHIALVRNSGTIRLYVNGVQANSAANSTNFTDPNCRISGFIDTQASPYGYYGYISSARVIKGTCLYPSGTTFTPPTAPLTPVTNTQLLLSMTNAAIFDNSGMNNLETVGNAQIDTSVVKYGTSSMYFDGNGDYLIDDVGPQFAFGTSDFTIELWVNPTTVSAVQYLVDTRNPSSTTSAGVQWFVSASAKFGVYVGTTAVITASTNSLVAGVWTHLALVKSNGTWRIFINGVADATTGTNTTSLTQPYLTIACSCNQRAATTTDKYSGYMDDIRITTGVARYVGNFTPPVARMPNQ
jgi:hypothetical protein